MPGRRVELPGRGHPLLPPFLVDHQDASSITGRVTLGRFYLGRYGAAHGGVIPLLFDDVLGRLSNTSGALSRTAYLKVDYRRITPIGPELRVEATVDREEGASSSSPAACSTAPSWWPTPKGCSSSWGRASAERASGYEGGGRPALARSISSNTVRGSSKPVTSSITSRWACTSSAEGGGPSGACQPRPTPMAMRA